MDKFVRLEGLVAPLDRNNVDTDAIIPKQFLKSIKRSGFGPNAFDEWRYLDIGEPGADCSGRPKNPNFVLNLPRYQGAEILLTRANFGCGSSREHAPWALLDFGFKAIIAESFADIFFNNCYKNGIVPIVLPAAEVETLFRQVEATPGYTLIVDLPAQAVIRPDGSGCGFAIDGFRKECLINGWDDIGLTLRHAEKIREFEEKRRFSQPWLFAQGGKS
jgi:3-isopropylmalate/(R)-2-methylmalate dehydratase small subunit